MSKIKYFLEQSWLIIAASFIFGALLACTNAAWKPLIEQNEIDKFNNEARKLLPDAVKFESPKGVETFLAQLGKGKTAEPKIKQAFNANNVCVGWAFIAEGPGFADKIKLVITTDAKFENLQGFGVLFSNETPGFGDKIKNAPFQSQFAGAPVAEFYLSKIGDRQKIDSEIIAITGATVSSEAVVKIMNNFIEQIKTSTKKEGLID